MPSMKSSSDLRRRQKSKAFEEIDQDDYDFTNDVNDSYKKTRRQRRAKLHDSSDDGDDDRGKDILPKWKMALVIGAICVCFALVFPTVFSPLLNGIWSRGTTESGGGARRPPPMGGRTPPPSRGGPAMHPQMHMPPPHGGAGGETTTSRGRGGMFTWLMPFYTIGIVAFLGYNLYKRMFKANKRKKNRRYNDSDNSDSDTTGSEIGGKKLRMVQRRLRKTEAAMREILEQLEGIAATSGTVLDTVSSEAANNVDGKENNKNENIRLTDNQVQEVERGLRELRQLSDLYKKQQNEISNVCDENDDNEYDSDDYIPSDIDVEQTIHQDTAPESLSVHSQDNIEHPSPQGIYDLENKGSTLNLPSNENTGVSDNCDEPSSLKLEDLNITENKYSKQKLNKTKHLSAGVTRPSVNDEPKAEQNNRKTRSRGKRRVRRD